MEDRGEKDPKKTIVWRQIVHESRKKLIPMQENDEREHVKLVRAAKIKTPTNKASKSKTLPKHPNQSG